ncbi:hypothetical protein INR49_005115 [Caranx melampygus]|nr:hypothetical protein INR49_005115 [Caranx melampygus]
MTSWCSDKDSIVVVVGSSLAHTNSSLLKSCHWPSSPLLPTWQRQSRHRHCAPMCPAVAGSLISTKHNVDCNSTASVCASQVLLASVDLSEISAGYKTAEVLTSDMSVRGSRLWSVLMSGCVCMRLRLQRL